MTLNPSVSSGQASDDIDGMLRSYFLRQLPNPWPAPPSVSTSLRPFRRRSRMGLVRSRLALAASIALLIVGSLWVLGRSSAPDTDITLPTLHDTTADIRTRERAQHPSGKRFLPSSTQPNHGPTLPPIDLPPMK